MGFCLVDINVGIITHLLKLLVIPTIMSTQVALDH